MGVVILRLDFDPETTEPLSDRGLHFLLEVRREKGRAGEGCSDRETILDNNGGGRCVIKEEGDLTIEQ